MKPRQPKTNPTQSKAHPKPTHRKSNPAQITAHAKAAESKTNRRHNSKSNPKETQRNAQQTQPNLKHTQRKPQTGPAPPQAIRDSGPRIPTQLKASTQATKSTRTATARITHPAESKRKVIQTAGVGESVGTQAGESHRHTHLPESKRKVIQTTVVIESVGTQAGESHYGWKKDVIRIESRGQVTTTKSLSEIGLPMFRARGATPIWICCRTMLFNIDWHVSLNGFCG